VALRVARAAGIAALVLALTAPGASAINFSTQVVNYNSGLCLDVYQRSQSDGANVDQWSCSGGDWQRWFF